MPIASPTGYPEPEFQLAASCQRQTASCGSSNRNPSGIAHQYESGEKRLHLKVTMTGTNQTALMTRKAARFSASHQASSFHSAFDSGWSTGRNFAQTVFQPNPAEPKRKPSPTKTEPKAFLLSPGLEDPRRLFSFHADITEIEAAFTWASMASCTEKLCGEQRKRETGVEACSVSSTFCSVAWSTPRR